MFHQRALQIPALPLHQLSAAIAGSQWDALNSPATPHSFVRSPDGIFSQSFSNSKAADGAADNTQLAAKRVHSRSPAPFSESVVLMLMPGSDGGSDSDAGLDGLDGLDSGLTLDAIFGMFETGPTTGKKLAAVLPAAAAVAAADTSSQVAVVPSPSPTQQQQQQQQQTLQQQPPPQQPPQQQQSAITLPTPPTGSGTPVLHLDAAALQMLGGSAASIFGSPATPGSSPQPSEHSEHSGHSHSRSDHYLHARGASASPVPLGLRVEIPSASASASGPSSAVSSASAGYLGSACSSSRSEHYPNDYGYDSSASGGGSSAYSASPAVSPSAFGGSLAAAAAAAGTATPGAGGRAHRSGRVGPIRSRTKSARAAAAAASSRLQLQIQDEDACSSSPSSPSSPPAAYGGGKRGRTAGYSKTRAVSASASASPYPSPRESESASPLPEYTGPLPESYWGLDESMIASISYRDFTAIVQKSKLTTKQIAEAKKVRRRVKNRHSARLCSTRRRDRCQTTEEINQELVDKLSKAQSDNALLSDQIAALKHIVQERQKCEADAIREQAAMQAELNRVKALLAEHSHSRAGF